MSSLIVIFVCLLLGILLQKNKTLPLLPHLTLNTVILNVSLPAVCLLTVPRIEWEMKLLSVCLVAWIIFGMSYLFFTHLGAKLGWGRPVQGCLIITAGLCNSAFIGFPVIEMLYGVEGLKYAVLLDQPGSFLIVSSAALVVGSNFSGTRSRKRDLARRVVLFPPFMAFAVSLILGAAGLEAQGIIKEALEKIGSTLTPLAMISVGLQVKFKEVGIDLHYLFAGLLFKLLLAPAFIFLIYFNLGLPRHVFEVIVMESAMAPMITGGIVASSYNLHPRLSGLMIGVGVPLSFVTLTAWYIFL